MMKAKVSYLILIFGLVVSGCGLIDSIDRPKQAQVFEVHLQTWFDNTPVQVNIDGRTIFNDTITTGDILAYAAIIPVEVANGKHSLSVIANGVEADTLVTVQDTLYVGVNFDSQQKQISFVSQREPFPYR